MLTGGLGEHPLKERRTRRQDDFVRPNARLGTDQRDIDEGFGLQQGVERPQNVVLVVVPPKAVMLLIRHDFKLFFHLVSSLAAACATVGG